MTNLLKLQILNYFVKSLSPIKNPLNTILIEKNYKNVDQIFIKLVKLAKALPRTKTIESNNYYWSGVCRSLIFRFPDDLEILKIYSNNAEKISEGIIQIRSSSRLGQSDLDVNQRRVDFLIKQLEKI